MGEMGDLGVSFVRFLSWSVDLPMRASWSFANLAFARRWVGVWTWRIAVSTRREGVRKSRMMWLVGKPPATYHCDGYEVGLYSGGRGRRYVWGERAGSFLWGSASINSRLEPGREAEQQAASSRCP